MRTYFQQRAGQAAIGHNNDELLHVDHGDGANGKTKWAMTISAAFGDYAATIDAQLLIEGRRRSAGQPELMRLRGARLVIACETDESDRLNVALVKGLVGGDTIACRLLYENEIVEFTPTFSPWLVTNHKPAIAEQSEAIWRRVRLVPFDVTIPRNERDLTFQGKLLAELPGVLAWIVAGARAYVAAGGLQEPDEVERATAAYRDEENPVGRFVAERCRVANAGETIWVRNAELFAAWRDWCIQNGEEISNERSLGRRLSELRDEDGVRRFAPDRLPSGKRVRMGLALLPTEDVA